MIISEPETIVSHSEMIIFYIPTLVCVAKTMVFVTEMIIWVAKTMVFVTEMIICVPEKMVFEAEMIISARKTVLLEADTAFAVSEKTVGGAPAVVFHQQPTTRSCEEIVCLRSASADFGERARRTAPPSLSNRLDSIFSHLLTLKEV